MTWSRKHWTSAAAMAALLAWGWPAAYAQRDIPAAPPGLERGIERAAGAEQQGVETLTRGPVHEAFGAPTANDPEPTEVVKTQPPESIDEEAPEFKPEGAIWIPGYWDWDVATKKHIWVSGMWRVPPPGMRWVPTYWTQASGGWQRVPGFWVSAKATALDYQDTPPASLEVGPSTPSPGDNYFYVPGCWNYYDSGFRWRAGYWALYRDDYVWSPDRWYWTPRGSVFTAGFWDWRPGVRGSLFAPIAFTSNVYLQPGWRYRPWCVIDAARFYSHLWIGPRAHCYYFGDYYGPWSSRYGFTPWCDWRFGNQWCYDPIWAWSNVYWGRRGIDFIDRTSGWHRYYERHVDERPAVTFTDQRARITAGRIDVEKGQNILAADLREVAQRQDSPIRLARIDDRQRDSVRKVTEEMRELNRERSKLEVSASVASRERADRPAPGEVRGRKQSTESLKLPQVSEAVREATTSVEGPERADRPTRGGPAERTARVQPPRPEATTRPDRPERPARPERPDVRGPEAAPRTEAPRTKTPRTEAPRTEAPRTEAPRTEAPRTEAPQTESPRTEAPRTETPPPEAPRTEAPRTPRTETPSTEEPRTPRTETRRPELPDRPTPRAENPRSETPRTETPRVEAPRSEAPRTTPRVESSRAPTSRKGSPRISTAPKSGSDSDSPKGKGRDG